MLPPAVTGQPPMGAGPMSQRVGRQGDAAAASADIQKALEILMKALPSVPPGSSAHKAVYDCIGKLAKEFPAGQAPVGPGNTAIRNLAAQQQQGAGLEQIMKMMGGAGAQPGAGGPPAAAGGAPPMAA